MREGGRGGGGEGGREGGREGEREVLQVLKRVADAGVKLVSMLCAV